MFRSTYTTNDTMCCCRMQFSRVYKVAGAFDEVCMRLVEID